MNPNFANSAITSALATLESIPVAMHVPVIVALITGVLLLLFGARILRPAFILLGMAAGSLLGALLLPNFVPDALAGIPSPMLGLGVGALIGGCVALAMFRTAMGISSAVALGALATLAATIHLSHTPGALPAAPDTTAIKAAWNESAAEAAKTLAVEKTKSVSDRVRGVTAAKEPAPNETAAKATRDFLDQIFLQGRDWWASLPGDSRITLAAAMVGGTILGFVLGIVAPRKGAAIITSLLGAGMMLASIAWLVRGLDLPGKGLLAATPTLWLAAWLLPALAGVVFQIGGRTHRTRQQPAQPETAA